MAERLVISFDPGPVEQSQKVQDVFGHVLDLFDLLGHSGSADDDVVGWRLVRVSMNSPLTVEAEAIATRPVPPGFDVAVVARAQRTTFTRNVSELKTGRMPDAWRGSRELQRVRRAFDPSRTAATRIEVPAGDDRPKATRIDILPEDVPAIETALAGAVAEAIPRPKRQRGSIEGQLLEVGTHYNKPAIKLL
ncbi:hypothetical protein, partial [Piscinibacter sp.]|uniref:hypothetical protein n=1 Tax=Piscinibacter sp. TaxID=1903157 RepID=UPI002C3C3242